MNVENFSIELIQETLENLRPMVREIFLTSYCNSSKALNVEEKPHGLGPVTIVDQKVSTLFRDTFLGAKFPGLNFYSEEDMVSFGFPLLVLDPLDGTKEFVLGNPEFAVSFGIYFSEDFADPRNFSWIYNPVSGLEVSSHDLVCEDSFSWDKLDGKNRVAVSRSEFEEGLFRQHPHHDVLRPVGSIAYQLALLAQGKVDGVISLRPKNLWDIAAGTHLAILGGHRVELGPMQSISIKRELYSPKLAWFHPNHI